MKYFIGTQACGSLSGPRSSPPSNDRRTSILDGTIVLADSIFRRRHSSRDRADEGSQSGSTTESLVTVVFPLLVKTSFLTAMLCAGRTRVTTGRGAIEAVARRTAAFSVASGHEVDGWAPEGPSKPVGGVRVTGE